MEEILRRGMHNGVFRSPCKSPELLRSLSVVFSSHIVLDGVRIERIQRHASMAKVTVVIQKERYEEAKKSI